MEWNKRRSCKAITRKGSKCQNFAMSGTEFCYFHSFGKFRGIPLWKNSTVQFIVTVVLALIGIVLTYYFGIFGPSRSVKNKILEGMNALVEKSSSDELLKKYPGGYALFGFDPSKNYKLDSEKNVIVLKGSVIEEYEFLWDRVKISELTKDIVTIELPDILYKPLKTRILGNTMGIRRDLKESPRRLPINLVGVNNRIFVELIEDNTSFFVFAIGFKAEDGL
jgi:hypothetical protein